MKQLLILRGIAIIALAAVLYSFFNYFNKSNYRMGYTAGWNDRTAAQMANDDTFWQPLAKCIEKYGFDNSIRTNSITIGCADYKAFTPHFITTSQLSFVVNTIPTIPAPISSESGMILCNAAERKDSIKRFPGSQDEECYVENYPPLHPRP